MRAAFEHVDSSPEVSWRSRVVQGPAVPFTWHFHPEFELSLIAEGTGTRFVGDSITQYQPGDLVMIGTDLPHAFVSTPGDTQLAFVVQFRGDFLGADFFDSREFGAIRELLVRSKRGIKFGGQLPIRPLTDLHALPPARRTIALLGVLADLAESHDVAPLAGELYSPRVDRFGGERINAILHMLQANYGSTIRLVDVADAAHMTPAATSRYFRRTTGATITGYLNMIRVGVACRLLVDTDLPVTEIAAACGYQNLSHFNRQFRKLKGMPPRSFRARYHPAPRHGPPAQNA